MLNKEIKNKYNVLLAFLASVMIECATRVCYSGNVFGSYTDNYIRPWTVLSLVKVTVFFAVTLIVISFVDNVLKKTSFNKVENRLSKNAIISIWAVIIVIAWVPYILSYYPGGIYSDTFSSIYYAHGNMLTNRHPFLYNRIIRLFILLRFHYGRSVQWAMGLMLISQMVLLMIEMLFFINWMINRKVDARIRIISSVYLVFFNLIPLYGISIWKDTPFCMAVIILMIFSSDLFFELKNNGEVRIKTVIGFCVGLFLTSFTRNNGLYVCCVTVLVLFFVAFRKLKVLLPSIASLCIIAFIQGPVYDHYWITQTDPVENYAVPLQQIAATVVYDGAITDDQRNVINNIFPKGDLKEKYIPTNSDSLKFNDGFDAVYFNTHISEFLTTWAEMLKNNLGIYVRAYLLETLGFWNPFISSDVAYVQNIVWQNDYDVKQTDLFENIFGFSIQTIINPKVFISSGVFFWIFLTATLMGMKHFGAKYLFVFSPLLSIWLTIMIATPIAFSLRYISPMVFCIPFVLININRSLE